MNTTTERRIAELEIKLAQVEADRDREAAKVDRLERENAALKAAKSSSEVRPEFIRLPRPGHRCQLTGLCRSYIWQLINDGSVRSISVRQRNKARGVRLIVADSLIDYIAAQESRTKTA